MIVDIGNTTSDPRVLKKDFSVVKTSILTVYGSFDLMNPAFILKYDDTLVNCNYMYVREFDRYYYINKVSLEPNGRMIIAGAEDVLMSHLEQILNLKVNVSKSELYSAKYVPDGNVVATNKRNVEFVGASNILESPFTVGDSSVGSLTQRYVLTMIGG